ncbi:MAG: CHAT domain-containing protein, partial [Candidatus Magnetoovum sp. WYHC-5]|nr:CHAT domain-containing protein [Candidatus Magnetoovum sp. WYHC-5]
MVHINILIDNCNVSIGDTPTKHNFTQHFIDKLEKDGTLTETEYVGFGKNIFDNIFSTEDRRKLIAGHLQALSPTDLLIINIQSKEQPIHNIPFELINIDGTYTGFLLKRGNISLIRTIPNIEKKIEPIKPPVRILILLSLPLETYKNNPFDPLKELNIIYKALDTYISQGLIIVDIEEKVNKAKIEERLRKKQYHIIHFTGHGAKGGKLIIEDEHDSEKEKAIGVEEIKQIFQNSGVLLFYFDACQTAESTNLEPSLAYQIYKAIPTACVIANLVSVRDDMATQTAQHLYNSIFEDKFLQALTQPRSTLKEGWWKSVIFGNYEGKILTDGGSFKKPIVYRFTNLPPQTAVNYVYRYGIVRRASDLIEKKNYLVLHGIGGAGKSTLAIYLAEFFDAKFRHICFYDMRKGINTPEDLCKKILRQFKKYDSNNHKGLEALDLLDVISDALKDKILLILDNLEDTIQGRDGIIKPEWEELINAILNDRHIFVILTTRIKPRIDKRTHLDNILEIGEYTNAEVGFLARELQENGKHDYFMNKAEEIAVNYGFNPLFVSLAVDNAVGNLDTLLGYGEVKEVLSFYGDYFEKYQEDAQRLFLLDFPFSRQFMEAVFSIDFVMLITKDLAILMEEDNQFYPYKIIKAYFKNAFKVTEAPLKNFAYQVKKLFEECKIQYLDILNIFYIISWYYKTTSDKNVEECLVDIFMSMDFDQNPKLAEQIIKEIS